MTRLVVDASAVVDAIVGGPDRQALRGEIARARLIHVPEHFHVEVISAIRGLHRRQAVDAGQASAALAQVPRLRALRHPTLPMVKQIWALRDQLSVYDAAYLALARHLDLTLLTRDRALADAARADGRLVELG